MNKKHSWLERSPFPALPGLTYEILLFGGILLLAFVSRFYDLGTRVMSHDESLHTYFSWLLYKGQGYQHSPMMHGPFQFHFLALIYYLFGDSDFTARIPAALSSIATVWMVWYWRRYLGKAGALVASLMLVISPIMLFYGRYVRNEAFVGLFGIVMLYSILRYLETGKSRYLYLLTASLALHFSTKETSFIYTAQALLYLGVFFVARVTQRPWNNRRLFSAFIIILSVGILLATIALGAGIFEGKQAPPLQAQTVAPLDPTHPLEGGSLAQATTFSFTLVLAILAGIFIAGAVAILVIGYGWSALCAERSFGLLILIGTLILPQLTAFPVKLAGWNPTDYSTQGILHTALFLIPMAIISVAVGLLWEKNLWLKNAALFYAIFTVLYTTVFTNGPGFFTGMIGSLGYWLEQQGVERGSQPRYYYTLIQIPMYEFLPALGSLLAMLIGLKRLLGKWRTTPTLKAKDSTQPFETEAGSVPGPEPIKDPSARRNALTLLVWWSISSLLAYTLAGEKMPWLTYHIAWPMILLSGWGLGQVLARTNWADLRQRKVGLVIALLGLFFASTTSALLSILGAHPPFQGKELAQLQDTATFLLATLGALGSGAGLIYLVRDWDWQHAVRVGVLTFFTLLAVLTGRAAFRAAYVLYDTAMEYLVYAHAATGVKDVMRQVEEISRRINGDLGMPVAYDASAPDTGVSWPFVWYLRDYTNTRSFDVPTRSLREAPVIIVDQKNFEKIKPVVGDDYYVFNYMRMWWPNQDYFYLVSQREPSIPFDDTYPCKGVLAGLRLIRSKDYSRVCNAILNPSIRAGIIDIWLNRDYKRYAQATGSQSMTLTTWSPADEMRLYIRKDIAAQIWNYGMAAAAEIKPDAYQEKTIVLAADQIVGTGGSGPGQFNAPRGIAFAPDGSFYVADSRNHRVQHFSAAGEFLGMWGSFGDVGTGQAPLGTFNEPWGVAVGPDGSVYVTDTWNHRIQKFSADGKPLLAWGHYGLAETGDAFWGPRGIAVDSQGRVYVTDTGNKRVVVFDANGNYLSQFGTVGMEAGQFDEPVGLALDPDGNLYVADTWNQRIQVFAVSTDGLFYLPIRQWEVNGWFGQSLENKPFLAVDGQGNLFAADPEGYRILQFTTQGELVRVWGDYGIGPEKIGLAAAVAVDRNSHVWVTDAGNNRIMRFTLPRP